MAQFFEVKCLLFIILTLNKITHNSASGLGRCPKYNILKNFDVSKFLGQWYEIERSFYLFELMAGCTTIDLQENLDRKIEVVVRVINKWTGSESTSEGVAVVTKRNPSILKYKVNSALPTAIARLLPGAGYYQILYTDYNNFAILWTCTSYGVVHTDKVWVIGRKREISVPLRADIYSILTQLHIDSDRLLISKNTNCPEN